MRRRSEVSRGLLRVAAVCALAAALPGLALACPYCAGSREAGGAYFLSAIGMAFLPIGFGVGLVLWLRRRMRGGAPDDPAADPGSPAEQAPRR